MSESTCCTCGYTWRTGQHGGHSCTQVLQSRLDAAEARSRTRQEVAEDLARHLRAAGEELRALRQQLAERDAVLRAYDQPTRVAIKMLERTLSPTAMEIAAELRRCLGDACDLLSSAEPAKGGDGEVSRG